ncbi:MAG: fibronectin type III domain-containing protein, partial [Thermoanaerobaculia bacterium]|nr:fibronectin type III domain-containing protein [Thermoanaerobaculia bacterium]
PSHEIVGSWVSAVQNDTVTARILRIPLTEPLQLYFKASCAGGGQSWQGPYDLPAGASPPVPVRNIFCGEETYTLPEEEKDRFISYINTTPICGSSDYGERLFRYRANQTDTIAISFAGACGNCDMTAGCGFYYKPASQLPDLKDWKFIGCWKDILPPPALKFPVEKDSVYYILCNSFAGGSPLTSFSFRISDCNITCPMADSISLENTGPTSAVLRWNNAAPGGYYELVYFPVSGARPPISVTTADTMLTLTGLLPASAYTFRIRSFCSPTDPSALRSVTLQLAKHTVNRESFLGRCNPRFLPPGETKPVTYDVFDLIVPESGDYRLTSFTLNTYLYDTSFDPENPAFNLLVSVKQAVSGPYQDTLVALQSGKAYKWVISTIPDYPFGLDFNHNGYDNIKILAAGPGPAQIGAAQWKGAEPKPHGKVPLQVAVSGSEAGTCRDTSGWVHYYSWGVPPDVENDALLLSLKTNLDPEVLDDLPLAVYNYPPAAMLITNPPAEFVQNPDGFYEMNRFWGMLDLLPAQQIDQDFLVRFYYTQTDYELLKTAIESEGGKLDSHEDMYFHKINGFHDISNLDPQYRHIFVTRALAYDDYGYWQYTNGPEATPATWRHGTYNGEHYAEMVIRGFSGGGGGGSVNGKSVFDPVSKTTEPGAKRVFTLSPNPNAGVFNMEWASPAETGVILRITDPGGRLWREELVAAGSKRETVQAGDLPAGLYFLQVLKAGQVLAVEKFVKL